MLLFNHIADSQLPQTAGHITLPTNLLPTIAAMKFFVCLAAVVFLPSSEVLANPIQSKRYQCQDNLCKLQPRGSADGISQNHCLLICGEGQLWPYPRQSPKIQNSVTKINFPHSSDLLQINNGEEETLKAFTLWEEYQVTFLSSIQTSLPRTYQPSSELLQENSYNLKISLMIIDPTNTDLTLQTDESYSLSTSIDEQNHLVLVTIKSQTYFGSRHGLETLSQLIVWDEIQHSLLIASDVEIMDDTPHFRYRGVMLDLSRHFLSTEMIMKTIRVLSYNKMNILHLHLSDTASFPIEILNQPNLTAYGAYSTSEQITHQQANAIAAYAHAHGVIILPEVDTPAHVSAGWQWGEELILCSDPDGTSNEQWTTDALEPPSGQLNLANENIYPILRDIYSDLITKFSTTSGVIHLGGDEVIVGSDEDWASCYNSSTLAQPILSLLNDLGMSRQDPESFYFLWQNFTKTITDLALDSFTSTTRGGPTPSFHFWGGAGSSTVTYNLINRPDVTDTLPPALFTIQVWDESGDSITKSLIDQGYEVILSNTDYVYLDCGNAGWSNAGGYWCQPYHEWYHIYQYLSDVVEKWDLSEAQISKVQSLFYFTLSKLLDL
jgi:hexosaminidase